MTYEHFLSIHCWLSGQGLSIWGKYFSWFHHNHLHHLFQKCPSFNIPNCLANIFCPTWLLSKEGRVWCFQKFCQFISRFPITYNPTLHTPVQSEAPHRYLNTHPSSLPTQPHRYLNLDSKSLLHGDDDHHLFFNCNPHFLSFKLTVPKKQQSLIGGNGSRY